MVNKKIRRELLTMARADQVMRRGRYPWNNNKDRQRAKRLFDIITRYGWPDEQMVGTEGETAAWLIAQHTDFDIKLQAHFLKLLRTCVRKKGAPAPHLAYLEDRVRVNQGRPQLYGTQFRLNKLGKLTLWKIENRKQLDIKRKRIGLEPIALYRKRMLSKTVTIKKRR